MVGRIKKSTGSWYEILDESGNIIKGRLRGKLKQKSATATNPVAVGDWVEYYLDHSVDVETAVIDHVLERKNYLIRKAVKKSLQGHLLAANIDQVVVMATLAKPKTSLGFIDRVLVSCETFRIPVLILINKRDTWDEEQLHEAQFLKNAYEAIGYKVLGISATEGTGLDKLRAELKDRLSVVAGHSGTGKSTLLNQLNPDLRLKTQEISSFVNKGVHTTTFAEMHAIEGGGWFIDTPGIKELGLSEVEPEELGHYFPEIRDRMNDCKYNNCSHVHEPGCAILAAVETGDIWPERYKSYRSMLEGNDNRN